MSDTWPRARNLERVCMIGFGFAVGYAAGRLRARDRSPIPSDVVDDDADVVAAQAPRDVGPMQTLGGGAARQEPWTAWPAQWFASPSSGSCKKALKGQSGPSS